jgi:hypothetical protein
VLPGNTVAGEQSIAPGIDPFQPSQAQIFMPFMPGDMPFGTDMPGQSMFAKARLAIS